MQKLDFKQIADDAYKTALKLHSENHPVKLTARDRTGIKHAISGLIDGGMTDKDFLASFSLNRALRRAR